MVTKRIKNLKKTIAEYRVALSKKVKVKKLILFGSYARGTQRDYSDLDLAVVSHEFNGGSQKDYLLLDRAAREVTPLIEAFPYTPEEIRNCKKGSFLDEILRTGKVVYSS